MRSRVFAVFAAFVFALAALVFAASSSNPSTQRQMNIFTALVDVGWITTENLQVFLDGVKMSRKLQKEVNKIALGIEVVSVTRHYIFPGNPPPNTETMEFDIVFKHIGQKRVMFDKFVAVATASEIEMMNEATKILAREIVKEINVK